MVRSTSPFARRVRELREAGGVSQADLARRAGLSRQSLSQLEQEEREPTWEEVRGLARALEVGVAEFDPDGVHANQGPGVERLLEAARAYARSYDGAEQQGRNGAAQDPELFARFQDSQVELNLAALDLFAAEAVCPVRAVALQQAPPEASTSPPTPAGNTRKPRRKTAR